MVLYIDTTDFNKVVFAASAGKKVRKGSYKVDPHKSHETLGMFDDFLKKSKILNPKSKIQRIVVNKGPGSYTGTRIGVTIGQALGFAWKVPVKFVAKDKFKMNE